MQLLMIIFTYSMRMGIYVSSNIIIYNRFYRWNIETTSFIKIISIGFQNNTNVYPK
jgi:hypothetical protein